LLEFVLKEIGVLGGVESQECGTKASGEGGLWLSDASFSSSNLGGVAREEVVHGLARGELGDRREDAIGIAGEEEDSVGVVAQRLGLVVGDVVDWIGHTAVLSLLGIEEIHFLGHGIDGHVLEESIALDGSVDVWLSLLRKIDGLGVASSFKVEDPLVVPPMLVVTDELAAEGDETVGRGRGGESYLGSAERVVLPVPERPK
jgi:hypothetical protein